MRRMALHLLAAGLLISATCPPAAASNPLYNLSAAGYQPVAAPGSLVSAFGADLATTTEAATSTALPESLAGTLVKVKDSAGAERKALLLFVSPGQVNYVVPPETATGAATVTIQNANGVSSQGSLSIQSVAPGLFTANWDGKGVAAADGSRISNGVRTPVWALRFDQTYGRYLTAPMDVLAADGGVELSVYGTGIRGAKEVTATVGVQPVPVISKGPDAECQGLDKVVIQIPQALASRGIATLQLVADGVKANPVTVEILHYNYLNLGFETVTSGGKPWGWGLYGSGYEFAQDASVAHSGSRSLRIRNISAAAPAEGFSYQRLVAVAGKHIHISAFVKTADMTRDWAGLWFRVDGSSEPLSADEALSIDQAQCATGTSDWQQCSLDLDVSPDATQVLLALLHKGDGTAWFDDLQIEIDGFVYKQTPPMSGAPSAAQVDWVKQTAKPFQTPDAGSGFDDLAFVKDLVGDAHIVGLGEGTHGTSEFFRMKHRLLEHLATNMGFTVFAMEASMPEAYLLNNYVLNGVGDPKTLLKGLKNWPWNTQEVLDMIEWMRQFNASGKGRLQFTGFDFQTPSVAIANVKAFLQQADPSYLATVTPIYDQAQTIHSNRQNRVPEDASTVAAVLSDVREDVAVDDIVPEDASTVAAVLAAARAIWQYMEQHRSDYLAASSADDVDWAIQNARIVEQDVDPVATHRDQYMAENIEWILRHNPPGTKMVIWAHNGHISRYEGLMGSRLARAHDLDYLPVAQLFHSGWYNAESDAQRSANDAIPSFPGTLEYVLHSTGMPRLVLDLRKLATDDPGSAWLLGDMEWRTIGAGATRGWTPTGTLTSEYDAIVFFDDTGASALLPF